MAFMDPHERRTVTRDSGLRFKMTLPSVDFAEVEYVARKLAEHIAEVRLLQGRDESVQLLQTSGYAEWEVWYCRDETDEEVQARVNADARNVKPINARLIRAALLRQEAARLEAMSELDNPEEQFELASKALP